MDKKQLVICTLIVVLLSIILTGCSKELDQEDSRSSKKNRALTEASDPDEASDKASSSSILKKFREKSEDTKDSEDVTIPSEDRMEQKTEPELTDSMTEPIFTEQWSNDLADIAADPPVILDVHLEDYYGTWVLWIPGAMTDYYDITTGDYNTSVFTPGAGSGSLEIHKNGTYILDHKLWGDGPLKGKWYEAEPGEFASEPAIILSDGPTDTDWAVQKMSDGTFNLYYYWEAIDTWFFDTKLSK